MLDRGVFMSFSIKIYVACHQDFYVPTHPLIFPIQVGTTLSKKRINGMVHDDIGDNISSLNPYYCELTAQYWACKNDWADYYGFFHYRRYLSFNNKSLVTNITNLRDYPQPYVIFKVPNEENLYRLGYNTENMGQVISKFDIIAPIAEEMFVTVYDHYAMAYSHDIKDLDLVIKIINKKYPEFHTATQEYMNSTRHYFCNMYVMNKGIFNNYCTWLFGILKSFDKINDYYRNNMKIAYRVNGYLGERLFGIYFTWLKKQPNVRWAEVPRVHFQSLSEETGNFSIMKGINLFLPPGTRRRACIKKIIR